MTAEVVKEGFKLYKSGVDYQYGKAVLAINLYSEAMANLSIVVSKLEEIQVSDILDKEETLAAYDASLDALDSLREGITKLAIVGKSLSKVKDSIREMQIKMRKTRKKQKKSERKE